MALVIEAFTVVVKKDCIRPLLMNQLLYPPNNTAIDDDYIWRCNLMVKADADNFVQLLGEFELNIYQNPDLVIVNEFDQSMEPNCHWLKIGKWKKAVIAWKIGSDPRMIVAHNYWDPNVGSGLIFADETMAENLKFLRFEDNMEVLLNEDTGKEAYIVRTGKVGK